MSGADFSWFNQYCSYALRWASLICKAKERGFMTITLSPWDKSSMIKSWVKKYLCNLIVSPKVTAHYAKVCRSEKSFILSLSIKKKQASIKLKPA